jgi:hypothetical protein
MRKEPESVYDKWNISVGTDLTSEIIKKKDFFLESLKLTPTPYINEMYILLTNISE